MIDFEKALHDPAGAFAAPGDVVDAEGLTLDQKRQILRQWEIDARELSVAEEENMGGGETQELDRVLDALARLPETPATTIDAPTKKS